MKILLGADDSEFTGDLLRVLVQQFRVENTEILVLHVLQQVGSVVPEMAADCAPEMEGEGRSARTLVARIADELRSAGFKADTAVEVGDVRESIIDAAAKWSADLIVVGSHGRSGIRRFLLGSAGRVCGPPRQLFRGNCSEAKGCLTGLIDPDRGRMER